MQPSHGPRRWRPSHVLIAILIVAAGGYWIAQTLRSGSMLLDPASATSIVRSAPPDGERNVSVDSKVTAYLRPGHSIDSASLDVQSVRLYRPDGQLVPGQITANAAGNEIVFVPLANLAPATRYIFQIEGARNEGGDEVIPYGISFTTAASNGQQGPASAPGGLPHGVPGEASAK